MTVPAIPAKQGLYDPQYEHDSCGVGFVVDLKGRKTHKLIRDAITALLNLSHRGACGCEDNTGAEAGIDLPEPGQYGVGAFFASPIFSQREFGKRLFEAIVIDEGQALLGWR